MTGDELKAIRGNRSAQEFGQFIAERMAVQRPYTAQEVWNWENGRRPVPHRVTTVLTAYHQRRWLFVPHEGEFQMRLACPICRSQNFNKSLLATGVLEFDCGAAERLSNRKRKVIGACRRADPEEG